MHYTRVVALLALLVGLSECAESLSWDIVVARDQKFEFYYNGTLTHTEDIPSAHRIDSVSYDPVQYRLLFGDYDYGTLSSTIYSFDLSTRKTQSLGNTRRTDYVTRVAYEVVTQTLFWTEDLTISSFLLSSNEVVNNRLVTLNDYCRDIAVDSCERYIYWITDKEIERARFDGSEREVLIYSPVAQRLSLAVDSQTQKMYWTERILDGDKQVSIDSANLDGKNRRTLYIVTDVTLAFSLAVSKDSIYWQNSEQNGVWQLPKNQTHVARNLYSIYSTDCWYCHRIAANYTIEEQIQGLKSCHTLQGLIPKSEPECPECTVSICHNYCLQGNCSVNDEGLSACSCEAGYSGERCEVNECQDYCLNGGVCSRNEENKRVCRCTADYDGERCDVSICKDYCLHGNCSVGTEGQPKCSCMPGYSGKRCEVMVCHQYCLNGGVCSLNEEDEPTCQCTADYDGSRCEVSAHEDNRRDAGNSGEKKCACDQFCLNNGACSLNEASEPVCQCTADYEGKRCEVSVNKDFYLQITVTMGKEVKSP